MATQHTLIKTTAPGYATGSGLCLEVRYSDDSEWAKLKGAEAYNHNKAVSKENQIKQLVTYRDEWISNGPSKYRTAQFRIGSYKWVPELGGYAFEIAHTDPKTL